MSRPKYYTPVEVYAHNTPTDCWVSYLGKVYDLTKLCKQYSGKYLNNYISATVLYINR